MLYGRSTIIIIEQALCSSFKDFEDAVQYFCAIENGIDIIISRNTKDYKDTKIPVYTPAQFLESLEVKL